MAYYSSGNRYQKENPIVFNLIIINVLVWLAQTIITKINLTDLGSLYYYKAENFKPFQFVTSIFMHQPGNPGHLFFNMFSLYFVGTMLERYWGSKRFFIFYLVCGIGAGILTQFTIPYSVEAMANAAFDSEPTRGYTIDAIKESYLEQYRALGASGAIMGLLAGAAYLFPNTPVLIMFIPIPIKLKYVVILYVLYDLYGGVGNFVGDNVGHFAHLGGALIGFLLVLYWNKTNKKTFY